MKTWKPLLVAALALALVGVLTGTQPLMLGGGNADAIIGRPLTPMSYAGVARRSVHRNAYYGGGGYYGGAVAGAAVAGAAVGAAAAVSTLPAGCVMGGGMYTCGSMRYRPYYDGPNVVYQPY